MAEMAESTVPGIVSQNPGKPTFVAEYGTGKQTYITFFIILFVGFY